MFHSVQSLSNNQMVVFTHVIRKMFFVGRRHFPSLAIRSPEVSSRRDLNAVSLVCANVLPAPPPSDPPSPHTHTPISFSFSHLRLDLFLSNFLPTPLALQRLNLPNSVLQKERRSRRRSQQTKRNMEIIHRTVDEREQYYLTTTDWRYPDCIPSPFC